MDSHDAFRDRVFTHISLRRRGICYMSASSSNFRRLRVATHKRTATDHTKLHKLHYTPNNVATSTHPVNSLESGAKKYASMIEQVTSTSNDSHDAFHSYKLQQSPCYQTHGYRKLKQVSCWSQALNCVITIYKRNKKRPLDIQTRQAHLLSIELSEEASIKFLEYGCKVRTK